MKGPRRSIFFDEPDEAYLAAAELARAANDGRRLAEAAIRLSRLALLGLALSFLSGQNGTPGTTWCHVM